MNESGGGERTGTRPGGIASAAVTALTTWAFAQLPLHRIELCHAVANRASCRVAARAGYPAEGTPRESYRYGDGRRYDEHPHAGPTADATPARVEAWMTSNCSTGGNGWPGCTSPTST